MANPSSLDRRQAEAIAKKLNATVTPGRRHDLAVVVVDGTRVAGFGIRRGSSESHGHIPEQLHLSLRQTLDFARCSLSTEDYFDELRAKGIIPGAD